MKSTDPGYTKHNDVTAGQVCLTKPDGSTMMLTAVQNINQGTSSSLVFVVNPETMQSGDVMVRYTRPSIIKKLFTGGLALLRRVSAKIARRCFLITQ